MTTFIKIAFISIAVLLSPTLPIISILLLLVIITMQEKKLQTASNNERSYRHVIAIYEQSIYEQLRKHIGGTYNETKNEKKVVD